MSQRLLFKYKEQKNGQFKKLYENNLPVKGYLMSLNSEDFENYDATILRYIFFKTHIKQMAKLFL